MRCAVLCCALLCDLRSMPCPVLCCVGCALPCRALCSALCSAVSYAVLSCGVWCVVSRRLSVRGRQEIPSSSRCRWSSRLKLRRPSRQAARATPTTSTATTGSSVACPTPPSRWVRKHIGSRTELSPTEALPARTAAAGPLLFALPLEKEGSEWQYALVLDQKPTLKRTAMPSAHWDWPLVSSLPLANNTRQISPFRRTT